MNRRQFMMSVSQAAIMVAIPASIKVAQASENVVSELDPQAKEINYVSDSSKVTKEEFNFYVDESKCQNCKWFRPQGDKQLGSCVMYFPDQLVSADGWCVAWTLKK